MRTPLYLSPSGLATWEYSQDEYYLKYLADVRPPKMMQTPPMAVGSAFDAYVKAHIVSVMYSSIADRYQLDTLLCAQVDDNAELREEAFKAGRLCMDAYTQSGALADLMLELGCSLEQPRFEFTLQAGIDCAAGNVDGNVAGNVDGNVGGIVPVLGKPDCWYTRPDGSAVILDWKVNGYYSRSGASPKVGYAQLRKADGQRMGAHRAAMVVDGVNIAAYLEDIDYTWATQLCIYSWLMGAAVGSSFVVGIEQLAWRRGECRVASHRGRVSTPFQLALAKRLASCWSIVTSDWIFRDLSRSDSAERCKQLDARASVLDSDPDFAFVCG